MTLRVLHNRLQETASDEPLLRYAAAARDAVGCREVSVYRSVGRPTSVAIVESWESTGAHGGFWTGALAVGGVSDLLRESTTSDSDATLFASEFYAQRYFHRPDGRWVAKDADADGSVVVWPARGPVRVLIQSGRAVSVEHADPADDAAETRREPGCLQFEGYRSVEFEQDALVLELWADQVTYDRHWQLRLATRASAAARGTDSPPPAGVARIQGTFGIEFYRQVTFRHLYDRWLPTDDAQWADTVGWPE